MNTQGAEIFVNKMSAAQRQLNSAIRLYLRGEDELAVHTIAAAAYHLLRDLKNERGKSELVDQIRLGVFAFAHDLTMGRELPSSVTDQQTRSIIEDIAEKMRNGSITGPSEIDVSVSRMLERSHWSSISKPTNFLKHADRDAADLLNLASLGNHELIARACVSYGQMMDDLTPEMKVFGQLWLAETDDPVDADTSDLWYTLRTMEAGKRRLQCLEKIRELRGGKLEGD